MAGGGSSSSSSTPVDMTPQAFKGLQGPYAAVLGQLLGFNITNPNGTSTNPVSFTYPGGQFNGQGGGGTGSPMGTVGQQGGAPTAQPSGFNANESKNGTYNVQGGGSSNAGTNAPGSFGIGVPSVSQRTGAGQRPGFTVSNPNLGTGNPNDILNGIPTYQGPTTAPIGGNEQSLLNMLMGNANGTSSSSSGGQGLDANTQAFLQSIMGGAGLPGPQQPLGQFNQDVNNAHATAAYDPNSENPFLAAAISAAQRPTLQGLTETLTRDLPGRFTQAGQFSQPQGSSAFDRAAAIATRGAGDTMGDIATNLSYQQMNDQLQRAFTANQSARGAEDQSMQAQLARQNQNSQNAQDRQIQAAGIAPTASQAQVNNMVQNLQAQALPRLIQEYGIERGMDMFNNQMNGLLSVLGIAGGTTQPTISQKSESSSSTKPNLLPLIP